MAATLLDRLAAARRRAFVGRDAQLAQFGDLLRPEAGGAVLFVHGPGGVGKSTLLRHFGWLAEQAQRRLVWLDGLHTPGEAGDVGEVGAPGTVLLVDNVEPRLDDWLREDLLPRLAADAVAVLAGREPPSVAFRTDPGWYGVLRTVALDNLDRAQAEALLRLRGVPAELHGQAMALTHGHPLALALLADVCAQSGAVPAATPEILGVLTRSLAGTVPSPAHLAALEAASQVLVTTEPLLAALLDLPEARELFRWLRELSIMDYAARGLFPHDFVRDTLAGELRWRHPAACAAIRARARAYYHQQLASTDSSVLAEFVFLYRDHPVVGPYLGHVGPADRFVVDRPRPDEWPTLAAAVARHEGAESARIATRYHESQPRSARVVRRTADGAVAGLLLLVEPNDPVDPATAAVRGHDRALLVRHWLSVDTHQAVSDVQLFITLYLIRHYLSTPGLGRVFVACAEPQFWNDAFEYTDFHRTPSADFTVGGRTYGMFCHDWAAVPPMAWIALMADRNDATPSPVDDVPAATPGPGPAGGPVPPGPGPCPAGPSPADPLTVDPLTVDPLTVDPLTVGLLPADDGPADEPLTEAEFGAAVRAVLRDLTRADRLATTELARSRVVCARLPSPATGSQRAAAVRDVVRAAAATIEASPRDRKIYRVLHHTYLQPAPTQALAAELLDLPTSTYRRHLTAGITRLVEILWQQERDAAN